MSGRTLVFALALVALAPGAALADDAIIEEPAAGPQRESATRSHARDHENKTVETHHRTTWSWENVTWRQGATVVSVEWRETRYDSWGSDTSSDARYDWRESRTDREARLRASAASVEVDESVGFSNDTRRASHDVAGNRDRSRESAYALATPGAGAAFGWSLRERADVDQCRAWIAGVTTVTLLDRACLPSPHGFAWPTAVHEAFRDAGHDLLP